MLDRPFVHKRVHALLQLCLFFRRFRPGLALEAKRPNKPDELLLWLRGRYPNDTDEELIKRFREHARDDLHNSSSQALCTKFIITDVRFGS
jgi:hypothetical protein